MNNLDFRAAPPKEQSVRTIGAESIDGTAASLNRSQSLVAHAQRIDLGEARSRLKVKTVDRVFWRANDFVIGEGLLLKIEALGHDRMSLLSSKWQELIENCAFTDDVGLPGSGLIGFTSISFSGASSYPSTIEIAKRTTVMRGDLAWEVTVSGPDSHSSVEPQNSKIEAAAHFMEGQQSAKGFLESVRRATDSISQGKLKKVVLARDLLAQLPSSFSAQMAVERLHERYPGCWCYLIANQIGASPELLLRAERGEVSARVLAGTAARGTDPDVDRSIAEGLKHSHKNLQEHQFAVQSIVDSLGRVAHSVTADAEPHSAMLPDLWHLASDVRAQLLPGVTVLEALQEIHPTAAVAGTPTADALKLIADLEPFDRGGYAGPIGWVSSDGSAEFAIALRGGRFEPGSKIRAFAGSGIVAESDAESELAETELKFVAIRRAIESQ